MTNLNAKHLQPHLTHQVEIIQTPTKVHYAKLCCKDCAKDGKPLFLQWLTATELLQLGEINQAERAKLVESKKALKRNKNKAKPAKAWSQTTQKERDFYKSYQPRQSRAKTPSILIGDRLTLNCKYTGNSIHTIPVNYLKQLIKQHKINNTDDLKFIQLSIDNRTGSLAT